MVKKCDQRERELGSWKERQIQRKRERELEKEREREKEWEIEYERGIEVEKDNEGEIILSELKKCEGYYWVNVNDLMHYSHWDYDKQILITTINLRGH